MDEIDEGLRFFRKIIDGENVTLKPDISTTSIKEEVKDEPQINESAPLPEVVKNEVEKSPEQENGRLILGYHIQIKYLFLAFIILIILTILCIWLYKRRKSDGVDKNTVHKSRSYQDKMQIPKIKQDHAKNKFNTPIHEPSHVGSCCEDKKDGQLKGKDVNSNHKDKSSKKSVGDEDENIVILDEKTRKKKKQKKVHFDDEVKEGVLDGKKDNTKNDSNHDIIEERTKHDQMIYDNIDNIKAFLSK